VLIHGAIKTMKSQAPSLSEQKFLSNHLNSVRRGMFTCVGWQATLCDPVWQVTPRISEMEFN